tara:strand:+ start:247 stop:381 length:135 start_codon:yes stop_codon:yes gene_type:complete
MASSIMEDPKFLANLFFFTFSAVWFIFVAVGSHTFRRYNKDKNG